MATKKSRPMLDYHIGKTIGFNPRNPFGYFSLMGARHRQQELEAQKQKTDPSSNKPWWKR